MAKKKPTRKKTGGGTSARGGSSARKKAAPKKTPKKTTKKTSKKTAKRSTKRSTGSAASKKTAKKTAQKAAKKAASRTKSAAKKKAVKKTTKSAQKKTQKKTQKKVKKTAKKAAKKTSKKAAAAPAEKPPRKKIAKKTTRQEAKANDKKAGRKGITIVKPKPSRRSSGSSTPVTIPTFGSGLLGPGAPKRAPLIPSGPAASGPAEQAEEAKRLKKTPFKKKELTRFREILLDKRRELIGDVSHMENEALRSESGGTSHLPQHMAEQGSDTYDQAISLDLAAADRQLIREIDEALERIAEGTYGICELTGRPIRPDRLEELPWARYSIDAARELERRKS